MSLKTLAPAFKYVRALQKHKSKPAQYVTRDEKLSRYTNFSLEKQFAPFEGLQSHLLLREFTLPTMASNPSLMVHSFRNTKVITLAKPTL